MIEIKVENGIVSVQETEALYSGSANVISCRFAFDAGWEPFSKSAVFRVGGRAVTAVIGEDGVCTLPWELLTRANIGLAVEVGVYGVSAESEVLTTVWDSIGTVRDGSELGSDAREPGAGVYDQVMASIQRTNEKIEDYSGEMTTFLQRAESAARVAADSSTVAAKSEGVAVSSAQSAQSALAGVQDAIKNIPAGSTLIINDLTTGGAKAALSAEMGKVLGQRPNPNLLDNWYFANPVNQRNGYIIPPGKDVYSDSALTLRVSTTKVYCVADGVTSNYVTWISNGTRYYVKLSDAVRGYASTGYTIDRWNLITADTSLVVGEGITLNHTGSNIGVLRQIIESPSNLYGKTVTISVLMSDGQLVSKTGTFPSAPSGSLVGIANAALDPVPTRYVGAFLDTNGTVFVNIRTGPGSEMSIAAVKLELGNQQTLAHWDGSKWTLNEIPDYGEELAKCQRFQTVLDTLTILTPCYVSASTIMFRADLPTTMRDNPKLESPDGTMAIQTINGTTLGGFTFALNSSRPNKLYIIASKTSHGMTADNVRLCINGFALANANL